MTSPTNQDISINQESNAQERNARRKNAQRQAAFRQRRAQAVEAALAAKGLPPKPLISSLPGTRRWKAQHALVQATLEAMRDEMQDYFDERSDRWREGERGQAMADRLEQLDDLLAAAQSLEWD